MLQQMQHIVYLSFVLHEVSPSIPRIRSNRTELVRGWRTRKRAPTLSLHLPYKLAPSHPMYVPFPMIISAPDICSNYVKLAQRLTNARAITDPVPHQARSPQAIL